MKKHTGPFIVSFVLLFISAALFGFTRYLVDTSTGLDSFLYTLATGVGGADFGFIISAGFPYALIASAICLAGIFLDVLCKKLTRREYRKRTNPASAFFAFAFTLQAVICPVASAIYADSMLNVRRFISSGTTDIYEEYYTKPSDAQITFPAEPRNIVIIWLESMEYTYADASHGGIQDTNLIENLTRLADENLTIRGLHAAPYAGYTFGSMFAASCGTPYAFSLRRNVALADVPAQNVPFFWDILDSAGYTTGYVMGSDSRFAGTDKALSGHGVDYIFDLSTARETGYIPQDYYVNWGFEDSLVYDIAKDELAKLSAGDTPFCFMLSTMDTHYPVGYRCALCPDDYQEETANIVSCADRQAYDFVMWLKQQPYYENTVIFLTGDHPRMGSRLVKGADYDRRTLYNCLINAQTDAMLPVERDCTQFDLYPTLLSALGVQISGSRLGFGTDLLSGKPTLPEELGYEYFSAEIQKHSQFFLEYMQ